jgi:thiamine transporter ThiT
MARLSSLKSSILIASVAAGPLVFGFIVIGSITKQFPEPIDITPLGIAAYFSGSLMACIVGVIVALVATILGSSLMIALGNRLEIARARLVWLIVGALLGTAVCFAVDPGWASPEISVAFILTAAICAWLCRTSKPWEAL